MTDPTPEDRALTIVRGKLSNFPDHGARDGAAVYKITGEELGLILDGLLAPTEARASGEASLEIQHKFHALCQPAAMEHQVWMLRFCDQDMGDMVWDGADARQQAVEAWNRYNVAWDCYLFAAVDASALSLPGEAKPSGEVEPVGEAVPMPGSNGGFTMAAFKASDVPPGTKLYAAPAQLGGEDRV